ncbi:hypothetical protein [Comamonas sp. 17RB]|uniref:hypothetical protein n=1 Tax=Comamonas sp. 17RB TaxID=3047025 RepID=UPI0024B69CC0|nr:hypothetical protein [Comamonas sp. 17RB]MDI9855554.1 hypothetical protein [Comamonas sp. 17RB]
MSKTLSKLVGLIVATFTLVSCAPTTQPGMDNTAQNSGAIPVNQPHGIQVTYPPVYLREAPDKVDQAYFRLVVVPVDTQPTIIAKPSHIDRLTRAIGSYLWKSDEAIALVAKLKIGDQDLGTRPLVLSHQGESGTKVYGDPVISPWFRSSDTVQIQFITGHKITAESHLFQTLVPALVELGSLYAGGNILVKSLKNTTDLSTKTKKVDSAFEKAFSVNEQMPEQSQILDVTKVGSFLVAINGTNLVEVKVVPMGSVIAPGGDPKRMPSLSSEIQGKSISDKRVDSLVQANKNELNKNTAAGFASFCSAVATDLVAQGLNDVDRASILYSYLYRSEWNNKEAFRAESDPCTDETRALPKPPLSLASTSDLKVQHNNQRTERVNVLRATIWKSLPAILPKPAGNEWDSLVGDNVSLVSIKYPITLGGITLEAGKAIDMNVAEAQEFFQNAKLTQNRDRALKDGAIADENCFGVTGTKTSSFRGYCFYPDLTEGTKPLRMEFDFDGVFPTKSDDVLPRLVGVKFFPNR